MTPPPLRFLLLQVRDPGDPMGPHEVAAFRRALRPLPARIDVFDLLDRSLRAKDLVGADFVLMGGSGAYSAAVGGPWLETAMESLRTVHGSGVPAFASCWGFQAMARAMGGRVVHDRATAEVGTHELTLTDAGLADPLFAALGPTFDAQMGHEDRVETLPARATLLASSAKVENQAYRFDDAPVYCTQFHPELDAKGLFSRFAAYPRYVAEVAGMTTEELSAKVRDAPAAAQLVRRFVEMHLDLGPATATTPRGPSGPAP